MPPDPIPLSPAQRARRDFARSDLAAARVIDLATLGEPGLILLVERLRGHLDEALGLIDELAS
ncbi:hypothetical protein [Streptomyces cyaneofuscatus]|uniref:hypothetical protein n=1 Tax=Streptomyces cyaneofuscatus TaxID=66883 RepID=UPI0013DBD472|nr:hypothetical protein [Streptomyces cyaneofuscatus]NDZ63541.1 hypothetical protein [Streptomyces cyaneofuscatus]